MAAFIIIVVCYGILVYSLEFQYYIYSWLSITTIFISLNSTSNNQKPDINIVLNKCLCSIYSKQMTNVESIVFLTVFCLFLFVLIVCVYNLIEVFMRHKESLECLKFDDINIEICLKYIKR